MADIRVGSVSVSVEPDARGFNKKVEAQVLPAAERLGAKIGKQIQKSIAESVSKGLGEGFTTAGPTAKREGSKSGDDFGGTFSRAAKARIEAALKSLPTAEIGVSTSVADQKLKDLRAELQTLLTKRIGIDLSDTEAIAEIDSLRLRLAELAATSPNIQVHVDTLKASAELLAFKAELAALGGGGGELGRFKGVASGAGSALGGLFATMSSGIVIIGLLGTALIPLTAALVGVTAALLGPLAAAGGGLTLFGLLAGKAISNTNKVAKQIDDLKKKASTLVDPKAAKAALDQAKALEASLTGPQRAFLKAKETLSGAFQGLLSGKTGDALFKPIVSGMNLLAKILPALSPVIQAVSGAISGLLDSIAKKAGGPGFKSFIDSFAKLAGSSLKSIGDIIGGVTKALGGLFKAGSGTGTSALDSIAAAAQRLGNYLNSDQGQKKLKDFFQYLKDKGPGIAKNFVKIVDDIAKTLKNLEPTGRVVLRVVRNIADYIANTLVPNLRKGAKAIKAIPATIAAPFKAAFHGIQTAVGGAVKFILNAFANLLSGFANVLRGLGHIPGFDWAKKAADAMDRAAKAARGLAADINKLHDKSITVKTTYLSTKPPAQGHGPTVATGGYIRGPGTGTSDSIPAMLSNGEFVINAAATRRNYDLLHRINSQKFAAGGLASVTPSPTFRPSTSSRQEPYTRLHPSDINAIGNVILAGAGAVANGAIDAQAAYANTIGSMTR